MQIWSFLFSNTSFQTTDFIPIVQYRLEINMEATMDKLGLSVRKKTMFAASLCHAVGVNVRDTNISKTTAWRRTKQERIATSKAVKDSFVKPKHVTVHWDGKILKLQKKGTKLPKRNDSGRCKTMVQI